MMGTPSPRPIDMSLVADIENAWGVALSEEDRAGLLECLAFYLPTLSERQTIPGRRGAPVKDNERRFVVEFGLRFECAGGKAVGSWKRDGVAITGRFAAGLRVVWEAIPGGKQDLETFARHAKRNALGHWKSEGKAHRAQYNLGIYTAWRNS